MAQIILIISLLFLNSCMINNGKNYHWYKPNCSEEEYRIVRYKCLKESSSSNQAPIRTNPIAEAFINQSRSPAINGNQRMTNAMMSGFGSGLQTSHTLFNSRDLLFESCMEAYGFIWSPVNNN